MDIFQRKGILALCTSAATAIAVIIALAFPVGPARAEGGNPQCNSGAVSVSILSNCRVTQNEEADSHASASCSSSSSSSSSSSASAQDEGADRRRRR